MSKERITLLVPESKRDFCEGYLIGWLHPFRGAYPGTALAAATQANRPGGGETSRRRGPARIGTRRCIHYVAVTRGLVSVETSPTF